MGAKSFVGILFLFGFLQAKRRYDGYQVLQTTPTNDAQVQWLFQLESKYEVMFGEEIARDRPVSMMVPPGLVEEVTDLLEAEGMSVTVKIEDVQSVQDKEERWLKLATLGRISVDLHGFNAFGPILAKLKDWANERCPENVDCFSEKIGASYENRPIQVFKIGTPQSSPSSSPKKAVVIDSTTHAREWLGTATVLGFIDKLVTGYESDSSIRHLVDEYDWYFIPVVNPDGYVYSHEEDRLWRKNRRPNPGSTCVGTDLNRNFDFRWGREYKHTNMTLTCSGTVEHKGELFSEKTNCGSKRNFSFTIEEGVSHEPCSEIYCGETPGSEIETQVIMEFGRSLIRSYGEGNVIAWVTVHTFGHMWMFPWGNTKLGACERTNDFDDLMYVADAAADAVQNEFGENTWARGTSCEVIYETSGSSGDWEKSIGVKYSFALELRGDWFAVDASEISSSLQEFSEGVIAMMEAIEDKENVV